MQILELNNGHIWSVVFLLTEHARLRGAVMCEALNLGSFENAIIIITIRIICILC